MSNLATLEFEDMSSEQLELIVTKALAVRQKNLEQQLKLVIDRQNKTEEKISILEQQTSQNIAAIQDEVSKTQEIAVAKMRVTAPRYEYVNQGDFGRFFSVSIGSRTVGKLLKVVGLAMKAKGETTPYRERIPNYAMTIAAENYTGVKWHYEKCVDFIDKWLRSAGVYEQFYSIFTTVEMEKFISKLYDDYC